MDFPINAPSSTANLQQPLQQQQRLYEDFQPSASWIKEEENTLEIHLHDFKKEQLKVQLDYLGNLKISGERPISHINNGSNNNKWRRFHMEFRIPKNFFINQIQAKFVGGVLYVKLPKTITRIVTKQENRNNQQNKTQSTTPTPSTNRKIESGDHHEQNKDSEIREIIGPAGGNTSTSIIMAGDLNSRNRNDSHQLLGDVAADYNNPVQRMNHGRKEDNVARKPPGIRLESSYKFEIGGFEVRLNRPRWMRMIGKKNASLLMVVLVVASFGVYAIYKRFTRAYGTAIVDVSIQRLINIR